MKPKISPNNSSSKVGAALNMSIRLGTLTSGNNQLSLRLSLIPRRCIWNLSQQCSRAQTGGTARCGPCPSPFLHHPTCGGPRTQLPTPSPSLPSGDPGHTPGRQDCDLSLTAPQPHVSSCLQGRGSFQGLFPICGSHLSMGNSPLSQDHFL